MQKWWRRLKLRALWLEAIDDMIGYNDLMRQLKRGRAVTRLQKWFRRNKLRALWLEAIDDMIGYNDLMRQLKRGRAVTRLQKWFRRNKLRAMWLEAIEDMIGYNDLMRQLKRSREERLLLEAAAATRINAPARGHLARVRVQRLYDEHLALKPLARAYDLLILDVRAAIDALRLEQRHVAAVLIQSYGRRYICVTLAKAMIVAADEQQLLARQYNVLMAQVREAIFWSALSKQHGSAVTIQAYVRGHLARKRVLRMLEAKEELERDARQYDALIHAVRRAIELKLDAEARIRTEASVRIQAAERARVGRLVASGRRRVERPRAVGMAEMRQWAHDLLRLADRMPSDSWGFANLGSTLRCAPPCLLSLSLSAPALPWEQRFTCCLLPAACYLLLAAPDTLHMHMLCARGPSLSPIVTPLTRLLLSSPFLPAGPPSPFRSPSPSSPSPPLLGLSRTELDELQLEAASDHAFVAHELGVPLSESGGASSSSSSSFYGTSSWGRGGGGGSSSTIRPLLVFDCRDDLATGGGLAHGGAMTVGGYAADGGIERAFPLELETPLGRRRALLRQEMHGLTVDRESRRVLSRPLHALSSLGERPQMRLVEEEWLCRASSASASASPGGGGKPVALMETLCGEMVHFWQLGGRLHAATRAGRTGTAARVEEFIGASRLDYAGFAHCALTSGPHPHLHLVAGRRRRRRRRRRWRRTRRRQRWRRWWRWRRWRRWRLAGAACAHRAAQRVVRLVRAVQPSRAHRAALPAACGSLPRQLDTSGRASDLLRRGPL